MKNIQIKSDRERPRKIMRKYLEINELNSNIVYDKYYDVI